MLYNSFLSHLPIIIQLCRTSLFERASRLLAMSACQITKEAMACLHIVYFPSNLLRFLSLTIAAVVHMQRGFLLHFLVSLNNLTGFFLKRISHVLCSRIKTRLVLISAVLLTPVS